MKKNKKASIINVSVTHSANSTNQNMQFTRYRSKQGHGWAAEDANAMSDRLCGKKRDLCKNRSTSIFSYLDDFF